MAKIPNFRKEWCYNKVSTQAIIKASFKPMTNSSKRVREKERVWHISMQCIGKQGCCYVCILNQKLTYRFVQIWVRFFKYQYHTTKVDMKKYVTSFDARSWSNTFVLWDTTCYVSWIPKLSILNRAYKSVIQTECSKQSVLHKAY